MKTDARTLSVADRLNIQDLISRSNFYCDSGQVDEWVGTFATNGSFENSSGASYIGHEVLKRFALKREERSDVRDYVHWASNIVITPTEEGARTHTYIKLVEQTPNGCHIRASSMKIDDLIQENGQWRFKVRRSIRWPMGKSASWEIQA